MTRWAWVAIGLGLVLRVVVAGLHDEPRGDVVLDVGVARSLGAGRGFASGFERGVPVVAGADTPVPPQGHADQHPPLWPLVGALLAPVAGGPFEGLQLASWLAGLVLLWLTWRCADRLFESLPGAPDGMPALAAALVALSFLAVDGAGNGSLYSAQAALLLGLVEVSSAPRTRPIAAGLLLGALLMLNHQALVFAPLPLLVWGLVPPDGRRGRSLLAGLGVLLVAALCCLPWWLRNLSLFGTPLHSVNGLYLLYRAGVAPALDTSGEVPVMRLVDTLSAPDLARALSGFLRSNLLYAVTAGLFLWPGVLGPALVGAPGLVRRAARRADRRPLALALGTVAMLAVSLLWPGTKLRYMLVLLAPVLLLGLRVLLAPPRVGARRLALLAALAWSALLVLTLDDLTGSAEWARPRRWLSLVVMGAGAALLPTVAWLRGARRPALITAGLLTVLLTLGVQLGDGPGTAYHATPFLDDAFGQPAERTHEAAWERLRGAHGQLRKAGARHVLGPVGLIAFGDLTVVELSDGLPPTFAGPALAQLLGSRDDIDHVVLPVATRVALDRDAPAGTATWFDGRLREVARGDDGEEALAVHEVQR